MGIENSFWTKKFLQEILQDAIDLIPAARRGSIFLFSNNYLEMIAAVGYPIEKFKGVFLHYTEFLQGIDIHYNEESTVKVYTNIFESDKELMNKSLKVFEEYGRIDEIKSILSIALYKDDNIFALVSLDNFESYDAYSEHDVQAAKVYARIITKKLEYIDKTILAETANANFEMLLGLIAHELNNITQGLNMGTQLLFAKTKDDNQLSTVKSSLNELLLRQKVISHSSQVILKSGKQGENLLELDLLSFLNEWIKLKTILKPDLKIEFNTKLKKAPISANLLIKEVFNNLLTNSLKYKKEEIELKIEITLLQLKQQEKIPKPFIKSPDFYIIKFRDNGIGMSDELKSSLFKPFKRGVRGTKGVSGLGLGLAIVRSIMNTYNGFIWIEDSEIGKNNSGVTFWIGIPMQ